MFHFIVFQSLFSYPEYIGYPNNLRLFIGIYIPLNQCTCLLSNSKDIEQLGLLIGEVETEQGFCLLKFQK